MTTNSVFPFPIFPSIVPFIVAILSEVVGLVLFINSLSVNVPVVFSKYIQPAASPPAQVPDVNSIALTIPVAPELAPVIFVPTSNSVVPPLSNPILFGAIYAFKELYSIQTPTPILPVCSTVKVATPEVIEMFPADVEIAQIQEKYKK